MSNDTWSTPPEVFHALDQEFGFGHDVCAEHPVFNEYLIFKDGRVFSKKSSKFMKKSSHTHGYLIVKLSQREIRKGYLVHRLVAETFIDNPENHKTVNHIDGDKSNNHVSNLEWCSYAENNIHAHKLGLNYISKSNRHLSSLRASAVWDLFRERKRNGDNPDKTKAFKDFEMAKGEAA